MVSERADALIVGGQGTPKSGGYQGTEAESPSNRAGTELMQGVLVLGA